MGRPRRRPLPWRGREANIAWRHFTDRATRVTHTHDQQMRFETALVSDLRSTAARYPEDKPLRSLITDLRRASVRFNDGWDSHTVGFHTSDSKTVHHPDLGPVTVDCDTLTTPGNDLRIAVLSAPAGAGTAAQFDLLSAMGSQA